MDEKCIAGIKRVTGIARLDGAIARIADAAVADGLCEAVVLKGSIARGDADEFSGTLLSSSLLADGWWLSSRCMLLSGSA